jgi:DNA primase
MSLIKFDDGHWRYKCFGCGASGDPVTYLAKTRGVDFMKAVKQLSDAARAAPVKPQPVAYYDYFDEHGVLLYQSIRYEPKSFRLRRPNPENTGDGPKLAWIWDLCGVRRVLYRLPKLIWDGGVKDITGEEKATIYYVEGEKDVETLEKYGLLATTHAGGAGAFREELLQPLKGRRIVVVPDRDDPGMQLGRRVFAAARSQGSQIGFILLPRGKDVTDFFGENGTVKELLSLVK